MRSFICSVTRVCAALLLSLCVGWGVVGADDNQPLNAFCVDLSECANMGFVDEQAGDGKGGWSDQGPQNDFRGFDVHASEIKGVPFRIVDPERNNGKSILSFFRGLKTTTIDLPDDASGRYLYVLHSSCWNGLKKGERVGVISIEDRDGKTHTVDIASQVDVADWWNPARLRNGVVAVTKLNQRAIVGAYLSRFDLGAQVSPKSITLTTEGKAMWIVIGVTLTDGDIPLPGIKNLKIVQGADWKTLPDESLAIKKGTALDCSDWIDHAPAGTRGRLIAKSDGTLAFAKRPNSPVRFFVFSGFPTKDPESVEPLADTIVRQGYNMVRLHFMDYFVSGQTGRWGKTFSLEEQAEFDKRVAAGEPFLKKENVDLMDRFVAALKKRGVYLSLDGMTSWTGCYPASCWYPENGVLDMKSRLFCDPVARRHFHNTAKVIFTRTNPYTGTSLADDPQVALIVGVNETPWVLGTSKHPQVVQMFEPLWRAFLARRFKDFETYKKEWGKLGPEVTGFENAPMYVVGDIYPQGRAQLVDEFRDELEVETSKWIEQELRSFGYRGLFSMWDRIPELRRFRQRTDFEVVSMHGYFAHPTNSFQATSKTSPYSALGSALSWWRSVASVRIAGMPLAVMEYGHVYWNRYRYEEGLYVGAYGCFQDMSILTAHADPAALKPRVIGPFRVGVDPIARASQVVTGLLFMNRAVKVAPNRVDIQIPRDVIAAHPVMALSGDQTRIGLLTGFAGDPEGHSPAVTASLQLPLGDGTKIVNAEFYTTVVDKEDGTFAGAVRQLRTCGILSEENRTDAEKKIYESETGEILLDVPNKEFFVDTPTVAGVCSEKFEHAVSAGKLTVESSSTPASITLASRDGKVIEESGRLLLVISTDARNSNEEYEDEGGEIMLKPGTLPALMHTGRFAISVKRGKDSPKLRAWALAMDGTRRDELAVIVTPDGISLKVDTGKWQCGPSPFMELAIK